MMMFYAPWCGFCKRLKPDYSMAATELKDTHTLVAMDVNKPENSAARIKYNITGFPTLMYFEWVWRVLNFDGSLTILGSLYLTTKLPYYSYWDE